MGAGFRTELTVLTKDKIDTGMISISGSFLGSKLTLGGIHREH